MRKLLIGLVAFFTLFLAACNDEASQPTDVDEPTEPVVTEPEEPETPEEPVEEEEPEEPKFTYPLTGLAADEKPKNRVISVMINNHRRARPQTGLVNADMVYEFLAEGPISRFIALYQSDIPDRVGPVRSAREYFIETAKAHNAIYVYHGAAAFLEVDLRDGWVDNLNGMYYDNDKFLFERGTNRRAPHNSYVLLPNVYEMAKRNNIETEMEHESWDFLNEEEVESIQGESAYKVSIRYFDRLNVSYEYDQENGVYNRYSDGVMTKDYQTGEPMQVSNVLIYETEHRVIDDVGRRFIDRESGGKGYLIQKGKIQPIEWRNVDGLMKPFVDGEIAKLVPGKTWVNVIPLSPGLEQAVTYE